MVNKPNLNKRCKLSMCLRKQPRSYQKQQGSMIVIVIFIIVILGFLATNLVRVNWSDSDTNNRAIMGTQAWLLSHSVNEYVLSRMYPSPTTSDVAAQCTEIEAGNYNTSVQDNIIDNSTIQCDLVDLSCDDGGGARVLEGQTFYVVESRVSCGSGLYEVQRSQEIWVRE